MEAPAQKRRRRSFWDSGAEACFVELWGEKIDELRGARKNTHVYQEMASDITKQGYALSVSDIKYKIANLTAKYRKCKESIGPSGGSPTEWPLYDAVHRIIGGHRINNVDVVVEESIAGEIQDPRAVLSPLLVSPSSPSSSPPTSALPSPSPFSASVRTAKKTEYEKLINMYADFGKSFKEATAENTRICEDMATIEKEKLKVLKDMRDHTKKLTQGVLDFLGRYK